MDQLDARLRERLHVLADAVPVSAEPVATIGRSVSTTRSRVGRMSPLASGVAIVVIAAIGLALVDSATSPTTGASPLPVVSPSPELTASGLAESPGPTPEAGGSPSNGATHRAAVRSSTFPDECPTYGLSARRCAYIVDWALREAGVAADQATVELLGDPGCDGNGGTCYRTTMFVVRVRVTPGDGPASDHSVFCGVGGERSLLCTETPRIRPHDDDRRLPRCAVWRGPGSGTLRKPRAVDRSVSRGDGRAADSAESRNPDRSHRSIRRRRR